MSQVADAERKLMKELLEGTLLRTIEIKNAESYTKPPDQSPYAYHTLWMEVFAPKYGEFGLPPYSATRINTSLDNPTKFQSWLDQIQDKELAHRMRVWATKNNKRTLPSLLIPTETIKMNGIPEELKTAMNLRKIVSDLCNVYYIVLETLGFYLGTTKNVIRLVSDYYWKSKVAAYSPLKLSMVHKKTGLVLVGSNTKIKNELLI